MSLCLMIVLDGETVCEKPVTRKSEIEALMRRHQPPLARGSVAVLIDPDLPRRHPRRSTLLATSIHSTHGPVWGYEFKL